MKTTIQLPYREMGAPFSKGDIVHGEWVSCHNHKQVEILSVEQEDCLVTFTIVPTEKAMRISRQSRRPLINPVPYALRKWTVDKDGKPVLQEAK